MLMLEPAPPRTASGPDRPLFVLRDDGAVGPPPTTGPGPFLYRPDAPTFLKNRGTGLYPDGVELLDGVVLHRDRRDGDGPIDAVGSRHGRAVERAAALLREVCGPQKYHVRTERPVILSGYDAPLPDIAVVRGRGAAFRDRVPKAADLLLILEVAFAASPYDRLTKSRVFASAGVAVYWLLDLSAGTLEQRDLPHAATGGYRRLVTLELGEDDALVPLPGQRPPLPLADLLG